MLGRMSSGNGPHSDLGSDLASDLGSSSLPWMVVGSRSLPGSPADLMRRAAAVAIDTLIAVVVILGPLIALDQLLVAAAMDDAWLPAAAVWSLVFLLLYSPLSVSRKG